MSLDINHLRAEVKSLRLEESLTYDPIQCRIIQAQIKTLETIIEAVE